MDTFEIGTKVVTIIEPPATRVAWPSGACEATDRVCARFWIEKADGTVKGEYDYSAKIIIPDSGEGQEILAVGTICFNTSPLTVTQE